MKPSFFCLLVLLLSQSMSLRAQSVDDSIVLDTTKVILTDSITESMSLSSTLTDTVLVSSVVVVDTIVEYISSDSNLVDSVVDASAVVVDTTSIDTLIMVVDDLSYEGEPVEDSVWFDSEVFTANLIIPSYEEMIESYYHAVVAVDSRLNFNPYRYRPNSLSKVNSFTYLDVVMVPKDIPDLSDIAAVKADVDPFEKKEFGVAQEARQYVSERYPELVTTTWDQLPDPPKAEKAHIIYNIDLDMSVIDSGRHEMRRPAKIAKLSYSFNPWTTRLVTSVSASQTLYSNWAKGGDNQFSISAQIISDIDYQSFNKDTRWENNIEARLGYIHNQDNSFVKNLDLVRINTQFAQNAFNKWFYACNTEFSTQFFDSYDLSSDEKDAPISSFLAPAYLKIGLGLDYKYGTKKNKKIFSLQASPLSYNLTFVNDTAVIDQTTYGIEEGLRARQEIGGSIMVTSEYAIDDKFYLRSKLLLFSNYIDNPQNVDVNWNTTVTYNFSRILAMNFTLDVVYDDDTNILINELDDGTELYGQRLQIKEYLGFSLTYRFF